MLSVSTFVFAYHYERKLGIKEVKATKEEQKAISIDVLKMGLPLAASEIFPIMASYLIRLNISSHGGVEDVGANIFARGVCLPSDNKMTAEQQDRIIEVIRACFE